MLVPFAPTSLLVAAVLAAGRRRAAVPPQRRTRSCRPPARSTPTSSCSIAAPTRCSKKNWLEAREYFKKLVDTYPQSTYRAGRQARHRRLVHRREAHRLDILAVNEFQRVPAVLSAATRAPTTRSTGSALAAVEADARRRSATRPPRATRCRSATRSSRPTRRASSARGRRGDAPAGAGPAVRVRVRGRAVLLPHALVSAARSTASGRCSRTIPSSRSSDGCTSTSASRSTRAEAEAEALPYYAKIVRSSTEERVRQEGAGADGDDRDQALTRSRAALGSAARRARRRGARRPARPSGEQPR